MKRAIGEIGNLIAGFGVFPTDNGAPVSVDRAVHDGDTLNVVADGYFGVRFLGIDAPEVSFTLPRKRREPAPRGFAEELAHIEGFTENLPSIGNEKWEEFLTNPFSTEYVPFLDETNQPVEPLTILGRGLLRDLQARLGPGCARNHAAHANRATIYLRRLVQHDVDERQQQGKPFRYFMAFAHEIADSYGRLLCYLHRDDTREERQTRKSYNGWLLDAGFVSPYFIWPNIDPFRTAPTLMQAVPEPGQLADWIAVAPRFVEARQAVRLAREQRRGLFEAVPDFGPLRLLPFELRYLAQRRAPHRFVIDLSKAGAPDGRKLLKPTQYYKIPNWEDRLFINPEYVPLFQKKGYVIAR